MKRLIISLIMVLILASTCQAAVLFAICKLQGGNPTFWGQVQGTAGDGWFSSNTYAVIPDNTRGLCAISGTAAQLTFIGGLTDVLPICTKANRDNLVPTTTRNKVNTWLTNNGYSYQFPASTTGIQMAKRIYKEFNGINYDQEGAPDPEDVQQ